MEQYIYNEKNGLWYKLHNDYYLPCLKLPEDEQRPIGIWGCGCPVDTSAEGRSTDRAGRRDRRHLRYIREHRIALYTELLTSGRLNAYLADLNEEAEAMLFRLVKELAEKEGVTEKLKAEDGMKWVQAMNNIRNRAAEVVYNDLIYN